MPEPESSVCARSLTEAMHTILSRSISCEWPHRLATARRLPFFERLVFSLRHYKQIDVLAAYPRTRAWLETAMCRESFVKTRRPEDKLVALYDRFLAVDYAFGGLNKN